MTETELIDKYICQHIEPEGDYLYRLYRATNIHTIHGRMASGHIQGRLLKMLVEMIRPKNILEVGTFSGYSAICLAQGLQEGGKLYTFEINDEMEDFTRPWIEGSNVADKIDFRMDIFEAFTRGYVESASSFLTPLEISLLPYAAELFPYMQAVRFLWDYLNGDHYWKCKYPEHNLVRAKNQWPLFLKAKEHEAEMKQFIEGLNK